MAGVVQQMDKHGLYLLTISPTGEMLVEFHADTGDIYFGNLKPIHSFKDFAFFVSFFPQLVAGFIVRASYFIPQINKKLNH